MHDLKQASILFIKFPEPGKVKTRLAASIGEKNTLELYKLFVEDIIKTMKMSGQ